jgi:hypothetical protein
MAVIADLIIEGSEAQFAATYANSASIAAQFAAPFALSFDFCEKSGTVRPLSWASRTPISLVKGHPVRRTKRSKGLTFTAAFVPQSVISSPIG